MQSPKDTIFQQIDEALALHDKLVKSDAEDPYAHLSRPEIAELVARLSSTIDSLAPEGHRYRKLVAVTLNREGIDKASSIELLVGQLKALRSDIEGGYLRRWEERVRAELFSDLLDVAGHFLADGFKDAAAIMAGGALEQHLRNLCVRHQLFARNDSRLERVSLQQLREKLFQHKAFDPSTNRNIKNWAKTRNRAAHRNDPPVDDREIKIMIDGIRHFIEKHPA